MCLLTYIAPHAQPDMALLENGAISNPDGHGWAILANESITVGHSMDMDVALTLFELARQHLPADGPALFHSRIATAGNIDTYNCHPFYVNNDKRTVIAHNGILPRNAQPNRKDPRSDTHLFADVWLPKGRFGHFRSRNGRRRLSRWLGYGNKMAMLTVDPKYSRDSYILNEHLGDWLPDGSMWFSNTSYKDDPWWKDPQYRAWLEDDENWVNYKDTSADSTGTVIGAHPDTKRELVVVSKGTTGVVMERGEAQSPF